METNTKYTQTDHLITKITAWIAGLIALALAVWGGITLSELYKYEDTNDAQVEEYINPVTSRVTGFIREIKYEENQEVKKGDTLLIIDNSEYQLQQEEGEAALSNAQAQIGVLESNVETTARISQASQSQIASVQAKLTRAQQDYDRYSKLFKVESATQQQLENSRAALDVATSEFRSAQENYQAALSKVNDIKAQKGVYQAEIKRRQALLNRSKLDVGYTVIRAPYNGKMGRRTIQQGQLIQAGQTLAYIVDQDAGKWVIANFKETQISHMHIGGIAEVTADAFPDHKFKGTIVSLSPATGARFSLLPPDNSTGNFVKIVQRIPVKVKLTESPETLAQLRAGMNANISIKKD
ncbi:membrane fusion protein, multidrug efflux system [Pedobacter westerhofensis]|uniref:Membrane fusion protein, multidrug efflux system n=1 Tax=Pedobacter westerhofensis TaxID=425512 RepID=A0A521BKD8_9SPHI|nr:HlyD family secretion protein [Pedobacter westerhofensis]SMO47120.1 membrane fusion protein, multidrug efflux system [Pedobacter westerhofensis]